METKNIDDTIVKLIKTDIDNSFDYIIPNNILKNNNELYISLTNLINNHDSKEELELVFSNLKVNDIINIIGTGPNDLRLLSIFLILNENNITSNEFILLKLLIEMRKKNFNENINIFKSIDELINSKLNE